MTEPSRVLEAHAAHDEPDLLRDQFRQLVRYRTLIVAGIVAGLLGGSWLGLSGEDTYAATSEVLVRSATADPFATGASADKGINIGSERQTAVSNTVAAAAAEILGADPADADDLQTSLQVTNPPNTLVLSFVYTAATPAEAATHANAFTKAYLDNRRTQTKATISNMVTGFRSQLDPLVKQREDLLQQIEGMTDERAVGTAYSVQANLVSRISELSGRISELKALDTTPGYIIRKAVAPDAPDGPGLTLLLALGAVAGLTLGLLAAWVRLVFDPAARSDGDVARALRAPVLGTLPPVGPGPLLAIDHTDSRLAEEYRSVAFRLAYDQRFADRRRLLVAGPRGAGGSATAVAVNLAASFAEMGMEVLLIEADLRTPGLSARLRSADGTRPGWARAGGTAESGWPSGLQVPIDAGESGSFDLIPGRRVRNVARSLTSAPATRLIAEADAPNSIVIVLAPPVLSYADALALVDRVDGVVVVCDPREVHRADLDRVRELISGAGGSVLGAVLHTAEEKPLLRRRGGERGPHAPHPTTPADGPAPGPDTDTGPDTGPPGPDTGPPGPALGLPGPALGLRTIQSSNR